MDNYAKKDSNYFLFFEYLGMTILTVAANFSSQTGIHQPQIMALVLFIISLVSWEISCAHFNSAVTIGTYIYSGNFKANSGALIAILVVQILGALTGIFVTWYLSLIVDSGDQKQTTPSPPTLCPQISSVVIPQLNINQFRCRVDGLHSYVLMYELFGSLCFVFTWIVLRNYKLMGDYANHKLESFIKAMLVGMLYLGCVSVGYKQSSFSMGVASGTFQVAGFFGMVANPTLALQTLIWSHGSYNYDYTSGDKLINHFDDQKMARYSYIYLLVPFLGAALGGHLAKKHLLTVEENKTK